MNAPVLDADALLSRAEQSTGLSDWGERSFEEPLRILVRSLNDEAGLHARAGRLLAERLAATLVQRLRLLEDRKRFPAIAEVPVRRPIIVTGNGRSGTTLLHNLLALAPDRRGISLWEMMRPSPPPEAARYHDDPRIAEVEETLVAQGLKSPSAMARHAFGSTRYEECTNLLELACVGGYWGAIANLPTYTGYRESADFHAPYRLHRRVLQQLLWRGPPGDPVLKAPEHMFHLPELLDTYPDAVVVFMHRDPARSIASLISIVAQMRSGFTGQVDIEAVKQSRFGYHRIMNRLRGIRAGLDRPGRFFDVQYADLDADPVGSVARLYAQVGLPFSAEHRARIEAYMAANPRHKHGQHSYALADYGLSFADVDRAFEPYIHDHGVCLERDGA